MNAARAPRFTMQRLDIDGTHLAYVDAGPRRGRPVVLLHGYLGSHLVWRRQIEPLAEQFRVIAPDWLGWGRSGRDPGLDYHYEVEMDRLARILEALGLERPAVVGHDYGGFLALGLAVHRPDRLGGLGIVNSRAQGTFNLRWRATFGALSLLCRTRPTRAAVAALPLTEIHRVSLGSLVERGIFDADCLEDYVGWMSGEPQGAAYFTRFMGQYRVAVRSELAAGLESIGCPTAVVWGARDAYIERFVAEELGRRIPGAELTMIEGAGHFLPEQRPDVVLGALRALLARGAQPAAA